MFRRGKVPYCTSYATFPLSESILPTALQVVMWFAGLRVGVAFAIASVFTPQVVLFLSCCCVCDLFLLLHPKLTRNVVFLYAVEPVTSRPLCPNPWVVMWFAGLRGGVAFAIACVFTPQVKPVMWWCYMQ